MKGFINKIRFRNAGLLLLTIFALTGCKTYRSSFTCPDAEGATCLPMDEVDRLIKNGEIEEYTGVRKKRCRGKVCKSSSEKGLLVPELVESYMPVSHIESGHEEEVMLEGKG